METSAFSCTMPVREQPIRAKGVQREQKKRTFSLRAVYSDLNGFERQKRNNSTCIGRSGNKVSTLQQSAITEQRKDQNKFNLRKR